ncbi:D-alanyl-D-alanine carboxypeptidase [Streptomyces sasae]|uniref:D-alanyl-D-alanine carboxypeptidase n=1 Tax=Streptomyces sasae TaxID=1266772 RepID=UPI0029318BC1|nr:D-alanyl-D-alanine carboxypeptidase [Streptomyces sasae]
MEEASVAGESPDRSKQRESSAEPTSGSADSVPEARDPRLAVAAEKETTGGVDTATRVFSVRDLKPNPAEENDTKLREAVAAWVRTGNPTEDAETSEDPEATPEHPAHAQEKATTPPETPEDRAERPEDAAEGQEPPQTPKTTQKANTKPKATPEPPSETDTAPEDAKPAAEPKADAEPEDAKPADKANAEPEDAKPADKANAEPEDAKPADEPIADAEPEDAKPADAPKADAEPEDAKPAAKPKADAEPEDAKPADEPKGDVRDAVPGDEPADADGEDDPQGPPAPDSDGRTGGAGGDTKTATHDEPEDAEPADKAKADAEPADADGEDDPQGPPAPDNDGRTGGAGGDTETATDGEATPQGSAVDQPTTMLKAPRPPQVDQPTTTLKLGGKPSPKSPERTSKFVALKSDIQSEAKPDAKPAAKPETASTTRTTVIPQVGPERTTQQPLPPKPPLDLLAELTNTPPPPETSVRTAIRRVKIWTPLVIVLLIVFAVVQTLRPLPQPTLDLTAKDTYTFDGSKTDIPWPAGGQAALDVQGIGTFGSSGDQKPVPIASVAKVMTAYIILRDHPLKSGAAGPKIKIDQAAQDQANAGQESTVDVTAGDSITQREALESILIASANNVARLLARWDAGSEKSFVVKMNATAKKLGMTNTTYTDPSGLTNSTVSTAVDQVKLAKAAMASEPAFREVAAMMSYDDYKGVNHGNWNQLVGQNNVVGIKTGTTTSALGNLVFAAKKDVNGETRTIIGAVIRQQANASNGNSILKAALNAGDQLIRAAQGALKSATIYKKGDVVGYADDGLGGRTPVVATQDVTAIGWSGLKVKLSFAADKVPHTAKAGTKVGTLTVGDGSGSAVQIPVALQKDLAEPGFTSKLTRLG